MSKSTNITWHDAGITKQERREQNNHHSFVLWFTGLSGSGKSTVANAVAKALFDKNIRNYVLDGDNVRFGLNKNLGFSAEDRTENIRRIGEVSKLFVDSGQVVLTAFISPFQEDRAQVREILEGNEFLEVYVECPLEECEKRDPKGLYKKARSGEIRDFTGIDSPYESPANPEVTINTSTQSVEECVQTVIEYLSNRKFI
ncbi:MULTISPECIES: adenylyl-sulfate kinase [Priestia]|uniref:Adenylyl-sulfate kinase n=4 Tax=Bacteria TaxID=2 RepID=A0AAX6BRQ4_PRIMG|nr:MULTISPECIES: adenylyl-sulfate kinase [Priestia]MBK0294622.1 adenylyl-sulfate kinase [Bacillus sp. S34]MCL9637459.1 adenylyl-sulfate kinase [Bacillus zanthoxyli]NHH91501.1 putative adenylyl-sulfate kinase [Bacillus sp. MB95]UPK50373.1 adenylyl-sulfate kinase [Bacillus sp. H8-1]AKP79895.1 putative adenylyl-sulfate kinase [Priestia megaterium Q3]